MKLYFIALIPDEALKKEIHKLKQEISDEFGAKKALSLPAHITLEAPFRYDEKEEKEIFLILEKFSKHQNPFEVSLEDFGVFSPRVIFIKIKNPQPVEMLFHSLRKELENNIKLFDKKRENSIHPHMTIAFRDLTPNTFRKAWPKYEKRRFRASFEAKSLFLLKHNGKTWDIYKKFLFQEYN